MNIHQLLSFTYIRKRLTCQTLPVSIKALCAFVGFTSISVLIGVLIVNFASPKPAPDACTFVLKPEARTSIKEDALPYFIVARDLNNDSRPDLVVANSGTNNIGVLFRQANNTFTNQVTYSTGPSSSPRAVAIADVNHDSLLDIAVANFGGHNVGLFLGTGNGLFAPIRTFSAESSHPQWVAVGEFNGDGHLDLAVANDGTDNIGILLGDGNGGFSRWTTYSTGFDSAPYSMALSDINGDNRTDIVVANYGTSDISLFLGHGNGTFSEQTSIVLDVNCHPESLVIEDLNHDGLVDVVVACTKAYFIGILLGQSDGTFKSVKKLDTGSDSWPSALLIGHFDSDNETDIIVANYETGILGVLHGNGKGNFSEQEVFYTSYQMKPQSITAADFNNDTRLDIALVNYDFNYVDVVLSYQNYTFLEQTTYRTSGSRTQPKSVAVADLNSDGWLDMIVVNSLTNAISVFIRTGSETFYRYVLSSADVTTPCFIISGDFNNDSRADIALANSATGDVDVLFGNGLGGLLTHASRSTSQNSGLLFLAAGDMNNDLRTDLIVVHSEDNSIGVLLGYGNGSFAEQKLSSTGADSEPCAVSIGDFNNDRRLDVAVANYGTNDALVLLGNGDGTFVQGASYATGFSSRPVAIALGDVNGDGSIDMVVANSADDNFVVLAGSGDGSFSMQDTYSTGDFSSPSSIAVGHLNNDSFLDVVVTNSQSNDVGVFLGYGNGTFRAMQTHSLDKDAEPVFFLIADMNNDKRADVVVVNEGASNVALLIGYGNGSLASPRTYSTMTGRSLPGSALIDDLNNDDRLDILVTNELGANVEIFFGDGDGKFSTRINYPTELNAKPISTAVGDFNNDSHVDFVLANYDANDVHCFLGDGHGSFSDAWQYFLGAKANPRAITVGDCNNDGRLDIVVANYNNHSIMILLGIGDGTFSFLRAYSTGDYSAPRWIGLADFNQDHRLDVIVANYDAATLGIFFGTGNGTFAPQMTLQIGLGTGATSAAVGDFDADGYPDIGMSSYFSDLLKVFLTRDNETFLLNRTYSTGAISRPKYSDVADLNNDGRLDILVTGEITNRLLVFFGVGDGTFLDGITYYTGDNTHPIAVTTGDLNKDNLTDAVVVNIEAGNIGIFLGTTHTNGVSEGTYSTGSASHPRAIALGHFNQDVQLDIVLANYGGSNIALLLGHANGTYPTQTPVSTGVLSRPSSTAIGDFDGDGQTDVAVADTFLAAVKVLYSYGNGSFAPFRSYSTGIGSVPQAIAVGDFTNDNRLDLVVGNSVTHSVFTLLRYDSGALRKPVPYSTGPNSSPRAVAVGELSGDGHLDFVVVNADTADIQVFLGLGNGTFYNAQTCSSGIATLPVSIAVADVNNDGHPDIIVGQCWGDAVGVFLGFGNGTFSNQITSQVDRGSGPEGVAVADLNQDGRMDVVVALHFSDQLGILYGGGDGTFSLAKTYSTDPGSAPISVAVGDVNNDTHLDIVVANFGTSNVLVFQGNADGTYTIAGDFSTGTESYPTAVVIEDLDKNGTLDIVIASSRTDRIGVFFGRNGGNFSRQISFSTGIGSGPRSLVLGDFNNDQQIDAAVANYAANNVGILLGHVEGGFFSLLTYTTGDSSQPSGLAVADFNNDNRLDVVVANSGSNSVNVLLGYESEDFIGAPHYRLANSSQPVSIAVHDLNEDSKLDIAIADNGTNSIIVMLGTGHGMFVSHTNYSTGNNSLPRSVVIADVNDDALPDIVVANTGTDNVGILLGNGNGTFGLQKTYFTGERSRPYAVAVVDFDNDRRQDIAVASFGSNSLGVFFGLGNSSFAEAIVFYTGYLSRPYGIATGDVNNDNLTDIVASNNGFGNIDILKKTC